LFILTRSALSSSFSELGHRWCFHSWSSLLCHWWCALVTEITNYGIIHSETRNTDNVHRQACTTESKPMCLLGLLGMFFHTCFQNKLKKRLPTISSSARLLIKSSTCLTQRWHTCCSELLRTPRMVFSSELINGLHSWGSNCV